MFYKQHSRTYITEVIIIINTFKFLKQYYIIVDGLEDPNQYY
jgi:hypothetical protein